jgi:hypothetical protein
MAAAAKRVYIGGAEFAVVHLSNRKIKTGRRQ